MSDDNNLCNKKLAFDNKKDAEASALVAEYQHGGKFKVYLCKNCGLWHIATSYNSD